jgi:signal transduction histidine kinase
MKRPSSGNAEPESTATLQALIRDCWPAIIERYNKLLAEFVTAEMAPTDKKFATETPVSADDLISAMREPGQFVAHFRADVADNGAPVAANPVATNTELAQQLAAYTVLRQALIEQVTSAAGRPLNLAELKILNGAIDNLAGRAILTIAAELQKQFGLAIQDQNQFFALANHELRGRLNGVLLTIQLLQTTLAGNDLAGESLQDLDRMRRAILAVFEKIDHLLRERERRLGGNFAAQRNFR